jgi:hypothetical protein
MTPLSIEEQPRSASDEVNLVPCVGLLRVVADRRVKLDYERAVRKDGNCEISGRRRAFGEGLCLADMNCACGWRHVRECFRTKLDGAPLLTPPATEWSNPERRARTDQARQRQDRDKSYVQDGCQFRYAVESRSVSRRLRDANKKLRAPSRSSWQSWVVGALADHAVS